MLAPVLILRETNIHLEQLLKRSVGLFSYAWIFLFPGYCSANQPPAPQSLIGEMLIIPVTILMILIGGGFAVYHAKRNKKVSKIKIIGVWFFTLLFSMMHEGLLFITTIILAIFSFVWSGRMILWGVNSADPRKVEKTPYLKNANTTRLIIGGGLIIPAIVLLLIASWAFIGWYASVNQSLVEAKIEKYLRLQLEQGAQTQKETGTLFFQQPEIETRDVIKLNGESFHFGWGDWAVEYVHGEDGGTFQLFVWAERFPIPPFNFFTWTTSYYADQTGKIRGIRVNSPQRCPADAPILMEVKISEPLKISPEPSD